MLHTQDISQQDYQRFKKFLEDACGILLGEGKQYLLVSRLTRLMRDENIANVAELLSTIERGYPRHIRDAVIDAMTTNETSWFRDGQPFQTLANVVFPEIDKKFSAGCRIWSSACSSGQEPYTISMVISEYVRQQPMSKLSNSQIVATDISNSVLDQAKQGIYENVALARGLTDSRKTQFFTAQGESWKVNEDIKRRVSFREQNLLQGFSGLGRFDIIFCRNVLIYFSADRKRDILTRMAQVMNPGGYLFLGASETITGYTDAFELIRSPHGSYYKKKS
jgi:chemotaxis protein methyltransferase CheR